MKGTQERLGHSDCRMTMEVYSHATAAMQDQAVAALDAFHDAFAKKATSISGQDSGQIDDTGIATKIENPQSLTGRGFQWWR
jgi:hypothetical protein